MRKGMAILDVIRNWVRRVRTLREFLIECADILVALAVHDNRLDFDVAETATIVVTEAPPGMAVLDLAVAEVVTTGEPALNVRRH